MTKVIGQSHRSKSHGKPRAKKWADSQVKVCGQGPRSMSVGSVTGQSRGQGLRVESQAKVGGQSRWAETQVKTVGKVGGQRDRSRSVGRVTG